MITRPLRLLALGMLCLACLPGVPRLAAREQPDSAPLPPAHWIVGISPYLERDAKDGVFRALGRLVLEGMPAGSSLAVYDAFHLKTVATISIPEAKAFRSSRTRANQFAGELNRIRQFLAASPDPAPAGAEMLTNAVRLPQFLDFVFENAGSAPETGQPPVLLVLGSPLYLDPKEPDCSMRDGYFPSDGHLLADRDRTVFGKGSRDSGIPNAVLHLGYFGDPWISDVHRERVQRFWNLYAARRGLRLGTFSADLPTVFAAVTRGPGPDSKEAGSPNFRGEGLDSKVEMVRITRDAGVSDWITREMLSGTRPPPPRTQRGPMKIGIRWRGDLDLDLYARPKEGGETLYFEHARSPEGYYFKDHRSSPNREYEFIEFESPVDVDAVTARINHFAGTSPRGPRGEVRIEFDGRIYAGDFQLTSRRGNEGREGRGQAPYWTEIDVPAILGLRSESRVAAP